MVAGRRGEEGGRGNKVSLLIAAAHTAGMFPISLVCTWNCICKIRGAISLFPPILIVCVCARMHQRLDSHSVAGMLSGFQSDLRSHYTGCFQKAPQWDEAVRKRK